MIPYTSPRLPLPSSVFDIDWGDTDPRLPGREARILAGSKGWYVVEPEPDEAVSLHGPVLSVEFAYAVLEEVEARIAHRRAYIDKLLNAGAL